MTIILGSQSKGRGQVLEKLGIPFERMAADIDEKAIRHEDPVKLTLLLANAKADVLVPSAPRDALLITGDSVVVCNGVLYEKPLSAEEEKDRLHEYASHPAEVISSVVVHNTTTGVRVEGVDIAKVYFHPIPENVVEQIIQDGTCFTQAGGFGIQDPLFQPYIAKYEGEIESIMAMPKALTLRLLQEAGYTPSTV